jgi:hypothetical protein
MRGVSLIVLSMLGAGASGTSMRVRADDSLPRSLLDTGLYAPGTKTPRADVMPFTPQYPLWSDGAAKRRWIWLPPGTAIDASRPDAWEFPRGTKLWKEFAHGEALETRYLERGDDGEWHFASYLWNADGTDAQLAPRAGIRELPAPAAPGATYSIPAENDCRACHEGAPVPVLGFSALQLSGDRDPLAPHSEGGATTDLRTFIARGLLVNLPEKLVQAPPRIAATSAAERAALGYLHGNCGNCHNAEGPLAVLDLNLAQRVAPPAGERNPALATLVGVRSDFRPAGAPPDAARISPGHSNESVLALRMRSRDPLQQMPPLGTRAVDEDAMTLITRWIDGLPNN